MVSAAICLTALIGCLSVSAAEGDAPVYTVVSAEGKKGGTVGVNVTGADLTKICGQSVNIIFAAGLEIGKVRDNLNNRDLVLVNDETGGEYNILSNEDGTKTVRLVDIINFPAYGETPALKTPSFDVTISVTIPTNASAGTVYSIIFDESQFADLNEKWVYPKLNNGEITVTEDAAGPIIDESLQLGRNILARDKLGVRLLVIKSQLAKYADYYVEVKSQHFVTNNIDNPYQLVNSTDLYKYVPDSSEVPPGYNKQAAEDSNYVYFDYTGITAYEMTLPLEITIYGLDNEGKVVAKSQKWTFTLANRILTNELTNSAADAVFVDMVNYATAVQTYFATLNPESDLAKHNVFPDEGFEAYQKYATTAVDSSNAISINEGIASEAANGAMVGKGLQIQATNQIYFMILAGSNNVDDLELKVTYVNSYGVDRSATAKVTDMTYSDGIYYYYFESDKNVALYDTAVEVKAELYSGDTLLYTRIYSVESFVKEAMAEADGTLKAIGDQLMRFTYSLRQKLGF